MNNRSYSWLYASIIMVIIVADRLTKWLALTYLIEGEYRIAPFLSFDLVMNRGISWSLFHSANPLIFAILNCVIAIIIVLFSVYCWMRLRAGYTIIGEICTLTGAISNLIDRLLYAGVIDFIHLSWGSWSWPVFNIADICIVGGIGLMIITLFKES